MRAAPRIVLIDPLNRALKRLSGSHIPFISIILGLVLASSPASAQLLFRHGEPTTQTTRVVRVDDTIWFTGLSDTAYRFEILEPTPPSTSNDIGYRVTLSSDGTCPESTTTVVAAAWDQTFIGSACGLFRFDGVSTARPVLEEAFGSSEILALAFDGRWLWIGTDQGVFRAEQANEAPRLLDCPTATPCEPIIAERTESLLVLDGEILIGTKGNGYRLDLQNLTRHPIFTGQKYWVRGFRRLDEHSIAILVSTNFSTPEPAEIGPAFRLDLQSGSVEQLGTQSTIRDVVTTPTATWLVTSATLFRMVNDDARPIYRADNPGAFARDKAFESLAPVDQGLVVGTSERAYLLSDQELIELQPRKDHAIAVLQIVPTERGTWLATSDGAYELSPDGTIEIALSTVKIFGTHVRLSGSLTIDRVRYRDADSVAEPRFFVAMHSNHKRFAQRESNLDQYSEWSTIDYPLAGPYSRVHYRVRDEFGNATDEQTIHVLSLRVVQFFQFILGLLVLFFLLIFLFFIGAIRSRHLIAGIQIFPKFFQLPFWWFLETPCGKSIIFKRRWQTEQWSEPDEQPEILELASDIAAELSPSETVRRHLPPFDARTPTATLTSLGSQLHRDTTRVVILVRLRNYMESKEDIEHAVLASPACRGVNDLEILRQLLQSGGFLFLFAAPDESSSDTKWAVGLSRFADAYPWKTNHIAIADQSIEIEGFTTLPSEPPATRQP
ncbi:MAG: hypothetical protein AAGD38_02100 [Acidobacteriota bacterium]